MKMTLLKDTVIRMDDEVRAVDMLVEMFLSLDCESQANFFQGCVNKAQKDWGIAAASMQFDNIGFQLKERGLIDGIDLLKYIIEASNLPPPERPEGVPIKDS